MSFLFYDLFFLTFFCLLTAWFLYSHKKNLKKEGLLYLYRTQLGIKIIDYIGKKYQRTLKCLSYISIICGYFLMAGMIYLFARIVWIYVSKPEVVRAIKIPPLMPLVPYLPQVFKLDFLPPLYFTYWIIIIALIAIPHEFAHGIMARRYDVKIKSTGFGFLGPFLAAFVEQDEGDMKKKGKFEQLSILSAGTFANLLTAFLFFILLVLFFYFSFVPSGVIYDNYAFSAVAVSNITEVNGINLTDYDYNSSLNLMKDSGWNKITTKNNITYLATKDMIKQENESWQKLGMIVVYNDAPAINVNLTGAITAINGVKVKDRTALATELKKYNPGDEVILTTATENSTREYSLVLGKNPENPELGWIGVVSYEQKSTGLLSSVYNKLGSFKDSHVYYKPRIDGMTLFIYNLLWWIVLISLSVALVNMIPVAIFDGGYVFFLTAMFFLKDEKKSQIAYKITTWIILLLVFYLMILWAWSWF